MAPASRTARPYTPTDLREIQDWIIKPSSRNVAGVTEINSIGGFAKEYQVAPSPERFLWPDLERRGHGLDRNNGNAGGLYREAGEQYLIRAPGQLRTQDDIGNVILATCKASRSASVTWQQEVGIGRNCALARATDNGRVVVLGTVFMLIGENSRTVSRAVDRRWRRSTATCPGYACGDGHDRTVLVDKAIETVKKNLLKGGLGDRHPVPVPRQHPGGGDHGHGDPAVDAVHVLGDGQLRVSANLMSLGPWTSASSSTVRW